MFAQSTMRPCYYRQGFDIALPLRARKMYHGLRRIAPQDRKYFATFKVRTEHVRSLFSVAGGNLGRWSRRKEGDGETEAEKDCIDCAYLCIVTRAITRFSFIEQELTAR